MKNHLTAAALIFGALALLTLCVYLGQQKDTMPPTTNGMQRNDTFEVITRTP